MSQFGDFSPLCTSVPSYPWCNLFYRQLVRTGNTAVFRGASANTTTAGVGINPTCFINPTFSPLGPTPRLGNIAHILACAVSFFLTLLFAFLAHRRKAAVGRLEFRALLFVYALTLPFNAVSSGAFLEQNSTALVVITAIHAGIVAALFWGLLANALVATQIVEDGTLSSMIPYYGLTAIIFGVTTYLSLDTALGITSVIGDPANMPQSLRSYSLFVLLIIWPLFTVVVYFALMTYIVLKVLHEKRPMAFYGLSAFLFAVSQIIWLLVGKVICNGSNRRLDGIFIATVLQTASIGVLFLAWRSITEDSWEDEYYPS
jgi:hypothetical protein